MGLCLCVFRPAAGEDEHREEFGACDVGHYSDFGCFRDTIARHLGGAQFPTLMEHSDSDGEWTIEDIPKLEKELHEIAAAFKHLPPETPLDAFEHTAEYREGAQSLYECFHDVNGDNLFESMLYLCQVARENDLPITFM
jgi:hypothetical protein